MEMESLVRSYADRQGLKTTDLKNEYANRIKLWQRPNTAGRFFSKPFQNVLDMFTNSVEWRRFTGTDTQLVLSNQSQTDKRQGRARELLTLHDSCSQAKHKVLQRLHLCLRHCMNSCQSSTPPLLASMSSLNNSSTLIVVAHSSSCSSIYRRAGSCFDSVPVPVFTIRALPSPRRLPPPSTALCSFIYVSHPSRALSSPLLAQFLSVSTTRSQPPPPPQNQL